MVPDCWVAFLNTETFLLVRFSVAEVNKYLKKLYYVTAITFFIIASFWFVVYQELYFYFKEPASINAEPRMVLITPGQSFESVTRILHEESIIQNPFRFKLIARIMGFDRNVKAGEYLLSSSMSPEKILETLVDGKVYLYRVSIPEGYNLSQVASLMDEKGIVNKKEFLKAANDPIFTEQLGIHAKNFEGYLFPDTYYFSKDISTRKIINTMVKQFHTIFNPIWVKRPPDIKFSIHEIVTLASIIEKETGIAEERPLISSVFHNRLNKNMRLQSDPTVIYGVEDFDGNLTRNHLNTPNPYNTYTTTGLPPGPIANPGKASLEAALVPPETPYLYFVSKNDNTHFFSTNYDDHREAVRKYQLNK
jgi:UPF0755 protein